MSITKGVQSRVLLVFAFAILLAGLIPLSASAAEDSLTAAKTSPLAQSENDPASSAIAEGTWGTCPWEISADGVLTVHPGEGGKATGGTLGLFSYWSDYQVNVKAVVFAEEGGKKVIAPQDCGSLLSGMLNIETVDLSGLDLSAVTNMSALFNGCSSLTSIDLSGIDASKATTLSGLFNGCSSLESVNLSNLNISSATDLSALFNVVDTYENPSSLVKADLSGLDASSATTMAALFRSCDSLESVNLSNIKAPALANMGAMFYDCRSLKSLNLSGFNTSSVQNMDAVFYGCSSLTSLDLTGFDTSNVKSMANMFKWCMSLKDLDISSFNTSQMTESGSVRNMFTGCTALARIVLGTNVAHLGDLPSNEMNGHTEWYSKQAGKWFASSEIAANRLGISDTYVKPETKSQKVTTTNKEFTAKAKTLAKKNVTYKASKVTKGNTAQGKLTYSKVKVDKKAADKKIDVKQSGKIIVEKGLKKGTYKVTTKASAASVIDCEAAIEYKAASKNFTVKIVVK